MCDKTAHIYPNSTDKVQPMLCAVNFKDMFELYFRGKKIALFKSRELAEKYAWENKLGFYGIFERRQELHG